MYTINQNTITGSVDDDKIVFANLAPESCPVFPYVVVFGLEGNDTINSNAASDFQAVSICGGEGNDIIQDTTRSDLLSGDAGDDIIHSFATIDGRDTVLGGDGQDQITVQGSASVDAGAGDDTIVLKMTFGARTRLRVSGGDGIDTATINGEGDGSYTFADVEHLLIGKEVTLTEAALQDLTLVSAERHGLSRISFGDSVDVDGSIFDASIRGWIRGSKFDDVLDFSTTESRLTLDDRNGNDVLKGNASNNLLIGDKGSDTVFGGGGDDKIYTSDEGTISRSDGDNVAFGEGGNDKIYSAAGTHTLDGGTGDDLIIVNSLGRHSSGVFLAQDGNDTIRLVGFIDSDTTVSGGMGHDTLVVNGTIADGAKIDVEVLTGGIVAAPAEFFNHFSEIKSSKGGLDIVLTDGGVFAPRSLPKYADLVGSNDADFVDLSHGHAAHGWQQVDLRDGDDTFIGTKFNDVVYGGKGNDTFVFDDSSGHDDIRDFASNAGETDVLDFSNSKIINNIGDVEAHSHDRDGETVIIFGQTEIVFDINGGKLGHLTEDNFIF
jgi:Ca2+-binding RTX toxin-like protein